MQSELSQTQGYSEQKKRLEQLIASCTNDPVRYAWMMIPWGEGELKGKQPMKWQLEVFEYIRDQIAENPYDPIQIAVAAGHGPGKTMVISLLVKWAMATRPHLNGVVTANTQNQLRQKTWRELAKWNRLSLDGHLFRWSPTGFFKVGHEETWSAHAVPNSPQNPDSFQGQHADNVLQIFDEASGIEDVIWDASDGATTTGRVIRVVMGNPTRNTGRFRSCFYSQKHRWKTWNIDVRDCEGEHINHKLLNQWVEDYGEDSDYVRVRVRGVFPKAATGQFFRSDHIERAIDFESPPGAWRMFPCIVGVDVARNDEGQDPDDSVIAIRQGPKLHNLISGKWESMELAREVQRVIDRWEPEATFIDTVGIGYGVHGALVDWGYNVHGVNNGMNAIDEARFANRRVEMGFKAKEWLPDADIPDDPELRKELEHIEYFFDSKNRWCLEQKRDLKKREGFSPDRVDAVSMTFAERIVKADNTPELLDQSGKFAWG